MNADPLKPVVREAKRLLVIVTEAALERDLVKEARRFGVHTYTIYDVRGATRSVEREGRWEADRTIEMKILCDAQDADRIAQELAGRFGAHFGITIFLASVDVFRPA